MTLPLHIALLELKLFLTNRAELAFSIALPILLFALMYGALSSDGEVFTPASVVDLDGGTHARELVRRLDALSEVDVEERSEASADDALDRSAILFAVVIPQGFSEAVESGKPAPLLFRQVGNGGDAGQIVAAFVQGIARDIAAQSNVQRQARDALSSTDVPVERINREAEASLASHRQSPPASVEVRHPGGGDSDGDDGLFSRLLPGLIVMFVMFSVTLAAQGMVEDRRTGTLERLMTTRLGVNQLFVGKFLAGVARALFQTVVMLSLAFVVFRPGGAMTFAELLAFSLLAAAAFTGVSLVIGAVARTRNQAAWAAVFFTLTMVVFSGTFFEIADGTLMHSISRATINAYAIEAMQNIIAFGEPLGQQWLAMAVMAVVAVISLIVGRLLFSITPEGR